MSLKYLAAYALISLNNSAPTKDQVSKVVAASGVKVDNADLDYVFEALKGKSVQTLIAEGQSKMSAAPAAGAAAPATAAAAPAAADNKKGAAPAKKKAPTPPPSDEDDDMIGGLF